MNIWDFQTRLTNRLLVWSALSVAFSALTVFSASPFLRGLGIQFLAWGAIDTAIAFFGAKASAKKRLKMQGQASAESEAQESRWLENILWVNTGLDVLYVLGGIWLIQHWGADSVLWRGHGWGIIVQGGFLLFFDFFHAFALRKLRTK